MARRGRKTDVREIDSRECLKVVTKNSFITACNLEKLSLKARKLLYVAISQCKQYDKEFYEFYISVPQFSDLMEIDPSNVYKVVNKLTDELMSSFITEREDEEWFHKYQLFSKCEYSKADSMIYFKLNPDMTNFLLYAKGNFTQPLLQDFVKMNSPYSMAIWHLMQREMKSKKPYSNVTDSFELTMEELRDVTETQKKFKQIGQFKTYVLDKAIREIKENCNVVISYENVKKGRSVTGFKFLATSPHYINERDLPLKARKVLRKADLIRKKSDVGLSPAEENELNSIILELGQMTFTDNGTLAEEGELF